MSASSPLAPHHDFSARLRPFRVRAIRLGASRLTLLAVGLAVVALLGAMWFDVIWELPASVRWFITRPGVLLTVGCTLATVYWQSRRITEDQMAASIDDAHRTGGEILAGWQLATRPTYPAGPLSQSMATLAAQRASERIVGVAPSQVIGTDLVKKASYFTLGAMVIVGLLWAIVPEIAAHQWSRFLNPSSDIPPYTGVTIDLELERKSVLYGQDVRVAARVSRAVERVMLTVRDSAGAETTIPMLAQGDSKWQAILTRVTEPLELVARSGATRSPALHLDVQMTPQIESVQVTITPPPYTRRAAYRGPLPEQGLTGLKGTHVAWEVKSNRPLASGRLQLLFNDGTTHQVTFAPVSADDGEPTSVTGELLLEKTGRFNLSVEDVAGIESHESVEGSITIVADTRPIVRIVQPLPVSLATPDINLPVTVLAEDDYGITSLALFRSLNSSPANRVLAEVDGDTRQEAQWVLPLAKFSLVPGDEIQLFARTEDNDPAGPKGAESPVTIVKIISVEEFQRMTVQRRGAESMLAKYREARRHFDQIESALKEVEAAAKEAAANPESAEAAEALQQKLAEAERVAAEASRSIAELSEQSLPIDVDRELAKRLGEMAKQASKMAEQLSGMQSPQDSAAAAQPSPSDKKQLTDNEMEQLQEMIAQASDAQKQLTQHAVNPLQHLNQIMPLIVAQQRFVQITRQQRDLANRMNSLKENDAPDNAETQRRVAELETEQEQLRQALDRLLDDIERGAADLPDDPDVEELRTSAQKFAAAVRDSQANAEMTGAQENLMAGKFPSAQQNAASAAAILESFLSQCNGMGKGACENCQMRFNPGAGGAPLGDSIQQMLAMMGMKPGMSGLTPGGMPGMGMGWGAGGGYTERFAGAQNVGMYGSLPMPAAQAQRGNSQHSSSGVIASNRIAATTGEGLAEAESNGSSQVGGQSLSAIPSRYRSQVAEYFRTIADELGADELGADEGATEPKD